MAFVDLALGVHRSVSGYSQNRRASIMDDLNS